MGKGGEKTNRLVCRHIFFCQFAVFFSFLRIFEPVFLLLSFEYSIFASCVRAQDMRLCTCESLVKTAKYRNYLQKYETIPY